MVRPDHIQVRQRAGGKASFGGVFRCGSVWVCAECAELIAYGRSGELEEIADLHLKAGGGETFVTCTARHELAHALKPLRKAVAESWTAVLRDGSFRRRLEEFGGYLAAVRSNEVTVGPFNGWHPHIHAVVFTERPLTLEETAELEEVIFHAWCAALERKGLPAPLRHDKDGKALGVLCEIVKSKEVAGYVARMGLALEVASTLGKVARGANRSMWQVLSDLHDHGRDHDVRLWHEWSVATKRAKSITWAGRKKLLARYDLKDELSDAELAALEEFRGDVVAHIARPAFEGFTRGPHSPAWRANVLELAEDHGGHSVLGYVQLCLWEWNDLTKPPPEVVAGERRSA